MASPASGKDERNLRCDWLPELSCPLGIPHCVSLEKWRPACHTPSFIDEAYSVRWLDIGLDLFVRVYGPQLSLGA